MIIHRLAPGSVSSLLAYHRRDLRLLRFLRSHGRDKDVEDSQVKSRAQMFFSHVCYTRFNMKIIYKKFYVGIKMLQAYRTLKKFLKKEKTVTFLSLEITH